MGHRRFTSSNLLNDEQFAAVSGDVGLCRFLIEQGADPLFENQYHTYAVFDALVKPDKAADIAVSFGRINCTNTLQFKPLHKAVLGLVPLPLGPLLDCSTADINVQDREGRTGLSWAITRDDIESSRLLLGHGADVIKSDNRGFGPIHSAKSLPSLKLLLDHNLDIMSKTAVGATPLHFVSRYGRHDMIEPMVKAHADQNAEKERNIIHLAAIHGDRTK
ncbi:hypothetical protein HO133_003203 [Letharia lupina]|uniref:Ankyrin repeat protein n=1 Tax=Letharia lupina TaxID=560253 RepID=A0A8H6F9B4_9LECA|nr:uncharacterized protein HO133_003203 [Letharia lupina]KAF6220072.1 hypothetical protein HO133_003203 [Letharia lupina]